MNILEIVDNFVLILDIIYLMMFMIFKLAMYVVILNIKRLNII